MLKAFPSSWPLDADVKLRLMKLMNNLIAIKNSYYI